MRNPSFDTWTIIFLFAAVQGFLLTFLLLLHKKGNTRANKILGLLTALFSLTLLYYVLFWTGYSAKYPWTNWWIETFPILFGPVTYWYVKTLNEKYTGKRFWLHFLPFYINALYTLPFILRNLFGRLDFLAQHFFSYGDTIDDIMHGFVVLQCISVMVYTGVLFYYIAREKHKLSEFSIEAEMVKYRWLRLVVSFYAVFAFALVSYWLLAITGLLKLQYDYAISATMSLFIYMIAYKNFRQPEIFNEKSGVSEEPILPAQMRIQHIKPMVKYKKSVLRQEDVTFHSERLIKYMLSEKPYLQNTLKIQDIAKALQLSTHHLSQIINEGLGVNYPDFINSYRIGEAKKILSLPHNNDKILSVAFDVGYNNKATFNVAFKKIAGCSPSEFRKMATGRQEDEKIRSGITG